MNEFERLQDEFQRGIMSGDDKVLGDILDSPKEKRDILFGVYRHAAGVLELGGAGEQWVVGAVEE